MNSRKINWLLFVGGIVLIIIIFLIMYFIVLKEVDESYLYEIWTIGLIIFFYTFASIYSNRDLRVMSLIPSFSVSTGMFFTFVVLYTNLKDFTIPEESGQEYLQSIVKLLSAAFSTSIIGLAGSVTSNIFIKLWKIELEKEEAEVKPYLDKNPNQFLFEMKEDIALIKQSFQNNIHEFLGKVQDSIKTGVEGVARTGITETQSTITRLNEEFTSATEKELREELNRLKGLFDEKREVLETASGNYQVKSQELDKALVNIASTLSALDTNLQRKVDEILEANIGKLKATFTHLENQQLTSQSNLDQTTKNFAGAVTQYQNTQNEISGLLRSLESQQNNNEATQSKMKELLTAWEGFSNRLAVQENRIADIANTIGQLDDIHKYLHTAQS